MTSSCAIGAPAASSAATVVRPGEDAEDEQAGRAGGPHLGHLGIGGEHAGRAAAELKIARPLPVSIVMTFCTACTRGCWGTGWVVGGAAGASPGGGAASAAGPTDQRDNYS